MKHICLIFCGGTMTMKRNVDGALAPYFTSRSLLHMVPQLSDFANITVIEVSNLDSSNMTTDIWTKLADTIKTNYDIYDGFVVTHGTDTMAYTASAISFVFHDAKKPIVFTGAQKPLEQVPSDAINNLINAVILAGKEHVGVAICFGPKILQGNRATKVSESSLDAFDSPMVKPMGEISLEQYIRIPEKPKKHQFGDWRHTTFDPNIMEIQLIPSISPVHLKALVDAGCHGVIIEGFGPGNVPESVLPFLEYAATKSVPVVILSQCRNGITHMQLYDVGVRALKAGGIPGLDMTIEAASAKLMWALSKTQNVEDIRALFAANIAGEVTIQ